MKLIFALRAAVFEIEQFKTLISPIRFINADKVQALRIYTPSPPQGAEIVFVFTLPAAIFMI